MIAEKKTSAGKFWDFLNSTFGIWFLSTCVVGTLTLLYANYKEKQEQQLQAARDSQRMETEQKEKQLEDARKNATLVTVLLPYLASNEEKQWRMAIAVTNYLEQSGQLPLELKSALEGIVAASTSGDSQEEKAKVIAAVSVIEKPIGLDSNKTSSPALPPRVYIQISSDAQRDIARRLQSQLNQNGYIARALKTCEENRLLKLSSAILTSMKRMKQKGSSQS